MNIVFESAPEGKTHRYQHGGETIWYRETEGNLFVWRDGSWYASTQKSAADLAKVFPFGAVTILTQEVQLTEDGEDDLTWLARNVHAWPAGDHQPWCYVITDNSGNKFASSVAFGAPKAPMLEKPDWISRRSELQNKPTQWPDGANWLAQDKDGEWHFYTDSTDNPPQNHGECNWYSDDVSVRCRHVGEVLGDWRDTLERRPIDLSEPAVTARLQEATGNVIAAAPELMTDKYKFEPFTSIEDNQELPMSKQQETQQDNGWFERGELPPVGCVCQFFSAGYDGDWFDWCIFHGKASCGGFIVEHHHRTSPERVAVTLLDPTLTKFRPIRIERDKVLECMMKDSGALPCETTESIMLNLYDAGYRKEAK